MRIKKVLSLILTVSVAVTSSPLIVQAEGEAVSSVTQMVEEIEDKMQTAPRPAEITEHFNIDSKDKFIEFMTEPKYYASNWETTLLCDINMGGAALEPISNYYGTFNGNGHAVSNMTFINCCFAIDNHGTISGIGFRDCQQVSVAGNAAAAGFVINNERDGMINNCFTENDIVNEHGSYVAGFVAKNEGHITGCKAIGEVKGKNQVGGFVGQNEGGTITECKATGNVTGNEYFVGGFVGWNYEGGTIIGCAAEVNVKGNDNIVGGFVGSNCKDVTITNCIATGNVRGDKRVGGFVGDNNFGAINGCTAYVNVIGNEYVGGFVGWNGGRKITNCAAKGNVRGEKNLGGFVGWNYCGTINGCTAYVNLTGNSDIGGFVGSNYVHGEITGCEAIGEVKGDYSIGGFVGSNKGQIIVCKAKGNLIGGKKVGGFVGCNGGGTITTCTSKGDVTGNSKVGGFVGFNSDIFGIIVGIIITCTATGTVTGEKNVGGFVGINCNGTIATCTAEGNVTGNEYVGGFVGGNNGGTINDCTAYVNVIGNAYVGGFVGKDEGTINGAEVIVKKQANELEENEKGKIINCHSIGNVTVIGNNTLDAIGNGKVLNKKKMVTGTITGILLAGTVGGVAFGTVGFDKAGNTLRNAWDSVKTFLNEKVTTNSDYKNVIGALIAFGIAAIIIIIPIEFHKKNHIDFPVGGFVGCNCGKIENCTSSGKVTVEKVSMCVSVGGFAGYNGVEGTITNCAAEDNVNVSTKLSGKAGGFVGNNNGMIYESKFSGERVYLSTGILYKDDCCGGFAGKNSAGGVIDWCEVGELKAEPVGYGKKVGKGITIVETTNKTKGGGLVGVAGKLSNTTNCTYNTRRKVNIGEVGVKVCYKIETGAIVINCYSK